MPLFSFKKKNRKVLFMDFDLTMTMTHSNGDGFIVCENNHFFAMVDGKRKPIQPEGVIQANHPNGIYCATINPQTGNPSVSYKGPPYPSPIQMTNPLLLDAVLGLATQKGWEPVVVSFHGGSGERSRQQTIRGQKVPFQDNNHGQPLRGGSPGIKAFLDYHLPPNRTYLKDKKHVVAQIADSEDREKYGKLPHILKAAKRLGIKLSNPKNQYIMGDDDEKNFQQGKLIAGMSTVPFTDVTKDSVTPLLQIACQAGISPSELHQAIHNSSFHYSNAAQYANKIVDQYNTYLKKLGRISESYRGPLPDVQLIRKLSDMSQNIGTAPEYAATQLLNEHLKNNQPAHLIRFDPDKQKYILSIIENKQIQHIEINTAKDYQRALSKKTSQPITPVDIALYSVNQKLNQGTKSELLSPIKFRLDQLKQQHMPTLGAALDRLKKAVSEVVDGMIRAKPQNGQAILLQLPQILPQEIALAIQMEMKRKHPQLDQAQKAVIPALQTHVQKAPALPQKKPMDEQAAQRRALPTPPGKK